MKMTNKELELQRHALHKAIQDVFRDDDSGLVIGCAMVVEVVKPDGSKSLMHRTFDTNGDTLLSWAGEGMVRDLLRAIEMQASAGMETAEEDDDDDSG